MNAVRRIETLELAIGPKETEDEARERALEEMSDEDLVHHVREIVAKYDRPGMEVPAEIIQAKKQLARYDARLAWEKEHWGHLPIRQDAERARQ
jgi:hypothetical protein